MRNAKVLVFVFILTLSVPIVCSADIPPIWHKYISPNAPTFAPCSTETVFMVAMRDSIHLWTKVFLPGSIPDGGLPTMMTRTPYKFTDPEHYNFCIYYEDQGRFFAERGYAYVLQDCRGRFESEGVFDPYRCEFADGRDVCEWIVAQDWSNGEIGTMGGSYDGFTALAAAVDNPYIKVVIADDAAQDIRYVFRDGAAGLGLVTWLYVLDHGEWPPDSLVHEISNALDVAGMDEFLLGRTDSFWQGFVDAELPLHPFWDDISLDGRYDEFCTPILSVHYTGLSNLDDAVKIWRGLVTDGCATYRDEYRLVVTPEGHCYHIGQIAYERTYVNQLMLDYIDVFLGGAALDLSDVPQVQFRAPNDDIDVYRGSDEWLPLDGYEMEFYLHNTSGSIEEGVLNDSFPFMESPDEFEIAPAVMDPYLYYPTVVYSSAPLTESLYVAGPPVLDLYVSATTPDADFFVSLYEVYEEFPDSFTIVGYGGFRARFHDGFDVITPLLPDEPINIEINMFPTAYRIKMGSTLILTITGGMAGFAENPLTCEPLAMQTEWLTSTHSIYHDTEHPSRLVLPLIPFGTGIVEHVLQKPEGISISTHPNPFNSSCEIKVKLAGDDDSQLRDEICIEIYDLRGTLRLRSVPGTSRSSSGAETNTTRTFIWQPDQSIASGIYLVKAMAENGQTAMKRVVYLR